MTVFISTHSLAMAEEISDRIGLLDRGRMKFLGTHRPIAEVAHPEQTHWKSFICGLTADYDTAETNGPAHPSKRAAEKGSLRLCPAARNIQHCTCRRPAVELPYSPGGAPFLLRRESQRVLAAAHWARDRLAAADAADVAIASDARSFVERAVLVGAVFPVLQRFRFAGRGARANHRAALQRLFRVADGDAHLFVGRSSCIAACIARPRRRCC